MSAIRRYASRHAARGTLAAFALFGCSGLTPASASDGAFTSRGGAVDYRTATVDATGTCESLGNANTTAKSVPAAGRVPAHCRVEGFLPTRIGFQINLPAKWNGRLYMFGNGGYAGEPHEGPGQQQTRDDALANGFATVRTDTGHLASEKPGATFAEDPVALANHGYLAVHATIAHAKDVVAAHYGRRQSYTYWDGCSTGGRQGVMSAYKYPEDFDGILAVAPTLDWSSIMIKGLWRRTALANSGLTLAKLQSTFAAVLQKCDAIDGVKDGLLDDPRKCDFDPTRDAPSCKPGSDEPNCLTGAQAAALKKVYAGPKGADIPGWVYDPPGFEDEATAINWIVRPDGSQANLGPMADSWMKYFGTKDPNYDPSTFDFATDAKLARASDHLMNPEPDLRAFQARGGKMITYWGWTDMALNATMGIDYYDRVRALHTAAKTPDFYRFFLIPGIAHCRGGYGPTTIDAMSPLIDWVEKGVAPERLRAQKIVDGKVVLDRAYCPYPAVTRYKGQGDANDISNYTCQMPAR